MTASSSARPLLLGTRRSPMAMAQSGFVAKLITERTGRAVGLTGISTAGDVSHAQLVQIGGTGVFAGALRERLLAGEIDLAVHSMKDLPAGPAAGLLIAAVPRRDEPWDALVSRDGMKLADLPPGARVGTGSPRRAAQLLLLRPDVRPVAIRGNAGTRLVKVVSGELDAVILGCAGLARIGRLEAISQVFGPEEMLPAAGQGALAIECRADDAELARLLAEIDDPPSHAATTAERAVLAGLQAGCSAPIGAYAAGTDMLRLDAIVAEPAGGTALRASAGGPAAEAGRLGREVAADLLALGAERYSAVSGVPGHLGSGDDAK